MIVDEYLFSNGFPSCEASSGRWGKSRNLGSSGSCCFLGFAESMLLPKYMYKNDCLRRKDCAERVEKLKVGSWIHQDLYPAANPEPGALEGHN